MNALLQVLLVAAAVSLPVYHLLRAKLLRRISANRLIMADAVCEMEKLLLTRRFKVGHACHDILFKMMFHAQLRQSFALPVFTASLPPEQEEAAKKIFLELQDTSSADQILRKFADAYFRVSVYTNAFAFALMLIRMTFSGRIKIAFGEPRKKAELSEKKKRKLAVAHAILKRQRSPGSLLLGNIGRTRAAMMVTSVALATPCVRASSQHSELTYTGSTSR